MIIGIIHKGSGLGDQLFSYIATRVRALDLGVDFGFVGKEFFKGASFMDLDWGSDTSMISTATIMPEGKVIIPLAEKLHGLKSFELNKPYYDPEFNFIPDGSIIDGYGAQDLRYFEHRLSEIKEWLKTEPLCGTWNKVCIINFRGGEFANVPELFLPQEYWDKAIKIMEDNITTSLDENDFLEFHVQTDDPDLAHKFFPKFHATKDIAYNWRTLRYVKNAIVSNSAFAIIPRLLKHLDNPEATTVAPRYWARRNTKEWINACNYYPKFTYI